jgi:hypothetical protein
LHGRCAFPLRLSFVGLFQDKICGSIFVSRFVLFFCFDIELRFLRAGIGGGELVKSLGGDTFEPRIGNLSAADGGDSTLVSDLVSILCLCGGSRSVPSPSRVWISSAIEKIGFDDFTGRISVPEILFESDSHLREIAGFHDCTSLCRIELPSSVEIISPFSFGNCTSLNDLIFSSDSHLCEIAGFSGCTSLCRIELPSSVEIIFGNDFGGCTSLRVLKFLSRSRMKANEASVHLRAFIDYEDEHERMKENRRRVNFLGLCHGSDWSEIL